jgi:hypothetical protein
MFFSCAAWAQTVFDIGLSRERRVYEFPVGGGYSHGHRPIFADTGFHYANSCSLIYLVNIFPGSYSLNFSYPAGDINLNPVVSLYDRWPYDPMVRRYELPMGPKVTYNRNQIKYRWNINISRFSNSSLLYITVEVPSRVNSQVYFPHDITISTQSLSPMHTLEKGITFLQGPTDLVLTGSVQASYSYAVDRADQSFDTGMLPAMPIKGDLVKNGAFKDGLNYWQPHRNRIVADNVKTFSLSDGILKIKASNESDREGLMQDINLDVTGAASVVLMADVMVKEQTLGGLGPYGRDAPIAIAIGYKDASGEEKSRSLVFYKGFYCLKPENADEKIDGQEVLKDQWYRNIFDLMQLEPKPVFIQYISLEGSGWPVREGWIRDVHLIKSGGKE